MVDRGVATIVIGLGNPLLSDDGVGIRIVQAVEQAMPAVRGLLFAEGALGGLRLMERLVGYERAVIVDACITGQWPPGTVVARDWEEMPGSRFTWSSHDTSLPVAMALGRAIGLVLPSVIRIWGVEVGEVDTFGERLSPQVEAAIPQVVQEVVAYLRGEQRS